MIIGSGFIARNFGNYVDELNELNICLYAAGVSNSQIQNNDLLEKEKKRIIDFSKDFSGKKKLVYFSTCSINDPSRNKSPYRKNKIDIEEIIKKKFKNFLIIRLPEVVGKSDNNSTLINYLYKKIQKREKFEVWGKAKRNLIDIDHAVILTINYLKNKKIKNIINVANPISFSILEIIKELENLSKIKANYSLIDKGDASWTIDVSSIAEEIKYCKIMFNKKYLNTLLNKYYF